MGYSAVTDWLEAERDEFIDAYLRDHPDATEFEAALMWAVYIPEPASPAIPQEENHE